MKPSSAYHAIIARIPDLDYEHARMVLAQLERQINKTALDEEARAYQAEPEREPHMTYQQQYRKCNKPACSTCTTSKGHGPYWYAFWSENGRTKSKYIGKDLPPGIDQGDRRIVTMPDGIILENAAG